MSPFQGAREEEITTMSFDERVKNGMLSVDDARKEQEHYTGEFVGRKGEGIVVKFGGGADITTFQNAAEMFSWVNATGGIIYEGQGNDRKVVAGEPIDKKMNRLGKG